VSRLPDALHSRAVLIGCSRYDHLDDIPAVTNNLRDLRQLLVDPTHGGFLATGCTVVQESGSPRRVFQTLREAAQQAEDTLLIYFTGHGLLGERNELYLALAEAQHDLLLYTALPYDQVKAALAESPALNRVVILDCCFAGRAIGDMAGPTEGVLGQTQVEGTYILTAASADRTALAPDGDPFTAFTGVLLELLQAGIPDGPELHTLDALFPRLRSALASRGLPEPRRSGTDTVSGLALTRNRAHQAQLVQPVQPVHPTLVDLRPIADHAHAVAPQPPAAPPGAANPLLAGPSHTSSRPARPSELTSVPRRPAGRQQTGPPQVARSGTSHRSVSGGTSVARRAISTRLSAHRPVVLATAAVAVATLAAIIWVGSRSGEVTKSSSASTAPTSSSVTPARTKSTTSSPSGRAVTLTVSSFDPTGAGFRQDADAWRSERYYTATFGELKGGIGLVLDLGAAHRLAAVTFEAVNGPLTVELRAGDAAPTSASTFPRVGGPATATGPATLPASSAGTHRYWMIWVTQLGPDGSSFNAVIRSVAATAPPESSVPA